MNCLMDNDVILKLAAVRLLDDWVKLAVRSGEEVRVLATAKHFFRRKRDLPQRYGAEAVQAAVRFAEHCVAISQAATPDMFALLIALPGVNDGQATLFSSALGRTEYLVVTGDKVSLKALHGAPTCTAIRDGLEGRIIAFEQVVLALIRHGSFPAIREKVVSGQRADTVLQVAFGLGLETTIEKATEALEHYIAGLRRETGDLLITTEGVERLLAK